MENHFFFSLSFSRHVNLGILRDVAMGKKEVAGRSCLSREREFSPPEGLSEEGTCIGPRVPTFFKKKKRKRRIKKGGKEGSPSGQLK